MILLAGGSGHLGAELVTVLTRRDHQVRVLSRFPDRARRRLGLGPEIAAGDVEDRLSLQEAMSGVECVVSAVSGFGPGGAGPKRIDFEGNVNLVRSAESAGVRGFVLVSVHGASPEHPLEVMRTKYAAEEALRTSSLDWVVIRPTVYKEAWAEIMRGPIASIRKAIVFGAGRNPVNFVSIHDVAEWVARAVTDPELSRQTIDVGGPENITFNELAVALGARSTVRVPARLLELARRVLQPLRPDLARLIEAAIAMDTTDMTFEPSSRQV